jgi:hypothetical protein
LIPGIVPRVVHGDHEDADRRANDLSAVADQVTQPGVYVMITIFCCFRDIFDDFRQKMAFFSKTNVMIKFLHNLHSFVLGQKSKFCATFFCKKKYF